MEKKKNISINASLYNQIKTYCDVNNIKIQETIESWIRKQFLIEKWGEMPSIFTDNDNIYPTQVNEQNQGKEENYHNNSDNNFTKNTSFTKEEIKNNDLIISPKKRRLK